MAVHFHEPVHVFSGEAAEANEVEQVLAEVVFFCHALADGGFLFAYVFFDLLQGVSELGFIAITLRLECGGFGLLF